MQVRGLGIEGVMEIVPNRFGDDRGVFAETYSAPRFAAHGLDMSWVQDNQSLSLAPRSLRGLHYQETPFAQDKLVRVLRGRILDVVVDIRPGSPSFGRWISTEVSAERFNQVFVPKGFAHGFLTLDRETEVFYKVSAPYSPDHDRGLRWNDPDIGVDWGLGAAMPVLSDKDRDAPFLSEIASALGINAGRGA